MTDQYLNEPMLDMFIFETTELIEQLEDCILKSEKQNFFTDDSINEIFRIMHTIKGSSAMMLFDNISSLAHSLEDVFFFMREEKSLHINYSSLIDLVLQGVDFIKTDLEKIKIGDFSKTDCSMLIGNIKDFLSVLKSDKKMIRTEDRSEEANSKQQYYVSRTKELNSNLKNIFKALIHFEEECEMENIRAYTIVYNLKDLVSELYHFPEDIVENDSTAIAIRKDGFALFFKTDEAYEDIKNILGQTAFLKDLELTIINESDFRSIIIKNTEHLDETYVKIPVIHEEIEKENNRTLSNSQQNIISVNVNKLDRLMDLVGELVITEAMVTMNPELKNLQLDNFHKSARQLKKITSELQDMVMSIRMVSLSTTFHKMHRIVRDMNKKLGKQTELEIIGESTEVDKNIIERISDPLMHIVRNSIDHGIEFIDERIKKGKNETGTITLEAKNSGRDVLIIIKDDGRGLDKISILKKARDNELIHKPANELSDSEIFNLILLPGFSTKEDVTEFSGRGVGMDVVIRNIESIGGTVSIDSIPGESTTIILKIPLTLAIISGMNIRVGSSYYTIPIVSIKESFKAKESDIVVDPAGNELIMVRGQCYSVIRLHNTYKVKNTVTNILDGIIIMVEHENHVCCIFADELLGEQQVVVKSLPNYIKSFKKINGLTGCTLLGDGSISLILDIAELIKYY